MSQRTAVTLFANAVGADANNFLEELEKQRKDKLYTHNPIEIKVSNDGLIVDNADIIEQAIELMRVRADEAIKNELDVENMELLKKEFNEIYQWLLATRTSVTSGFDALKSKFTANEKNLKDNIMGDIGKQILAMKEKTFVLAESNIKRELTIHIDQNNDLGIGLNLFDSFIADKRKTAGMLPSEKTGKTSAGSLRTIKDEFEKIAEPIRKAQELDKQKSLQSKNFQHYIDGISITGTNKEHIEAGIASLIQLKETVADNFPNIIEESNRSIKNKIELGDANIRALVFMAERDELQKKSDADAENDNPYMETVATLKDGVMFDDVGTLETKLTRLREIHPLLKDEKNIAEVVSIAESMKDLISQSKMATAPQGETPKEVAVTTKHYGIEDDAIDTLMFELQMSSVSAEDATGARGEFIAKFSELFKTDFIKEI